jgi:hypothetical protein
LRKARRDKFLSAAQVAYHYGYSLADALALSTSERYLLLAVSNSEDDKRWTKLGRILGTNWNISDLLDKKGDQQKEDDEEDTIFLPLLPFVAPELFNSVTKDAKERAARRNSLPRGTVELGTLSKAQAKALFQSFQVGAPESEE